MTIDSIPLKINMEHNHGGLEDHVPFFLWVICRFQPLIFQARYPRQIMINSTFHLGVYSMVFWSRNIYWIIPHSDGKRRCFFFFWLGYCSHRMHVWYIYLHLPQKSTKCRQMYKNPMDPMGLLLQTSTFAWSQCHQEKHTYLNSTDEFNGWCIVISKSAAWMAIFPSKWPANEQLTVGFFCCLY